MVQQLALPYNTPVPSVVDELEQRIRATLESSDRTEEAMIKAISETVITDRLAYGNEILFAWNEGRLFIHYKGLPVPCTLHRHALSGLAGMVGIPMQFINNLLKSSSVDAFRGELIAHNLNQLFHRDPLLSDFRKGNAGKFLHRLVGTELRAFLTSKYNTNVASLPTLQAFVAATKRLGGRFLDASRGPLRNSLKAFQVTPREVQDGQYLVFGVTWTNSDFGAGSLSVAQTLWDPRRNTRIVLDATYKKVHLGGVRQGGDHALSNNALRAETEAVAAAIESAVQDLLSAQSIESTLEAIRTAHEKAIDWRSLKSRLKDVLYTNEVDTIASFFEEGGSVVTGLTPPGRDMDGNVVASKWWAANMLGEMALQTLDVERRADLEREAGKFLTEFFKGTD